MTISAPTFQRLQTGVTSADDLRVRNPVNAALAWLSGDLVTQLNTHFGAVSTSISSALTTFRATANTWTAAQTIETAGATLLTLVSTDGGAANAPALNLYRNSATPAANDGLGRIQFDGNDSGGTRTAYALIDVTLTDPANASEDSSVRIVPLVNGGLTVAAQVSNGMIIGAPTGSFQGVGTLNLDNALYKDGNQVVSDRVTGYGDPFGAISRATFSITTVTTAGLAAFVAAMYTDLKAHGLVGN